jgi:hypothetical protein
MLAENDEPDNEANRNCENQAQGSSLKVLIVVFRIRPVYLHDNRFLFSGGCLLPS